MGHTTQGLFPKVTDRPAWGVAAITQHFAHARFPCSKEVALRHFAGAYAVRWTEDREIDARDLFARIPDQRFQDMHHLARAVQQAADALGLGEGGKMPTGAEP